MNAELQSFAYVSSHDLQEPLRKIQTFSSRLLEKESENLSDTGKDFLNRMGNAVKRMQLLIEDILAYSRTNTVERIFEKTNLNQLIEEVKEEFKEELAEKEATIDITSLCEISVIPFQFKQLLSNLISNSLKFSRHGIPPYIEIKSHIKNNTEAEKVFSDNYAKYCHISITDNGIGFDVEYKERIFEVFQRLHGKSEYKGTGIGLAIVKKIVENHNGIITATSAPNEGATFDIYLPLN